MNRNFEKIKIDKIILEQLHQKFKIFRELTDVNTQPKDRENVLRVERALLEEISSKLGKNLPSNTKSQAKTQNFNEKFKTQSMKHQNNLKVKFKNNFESRKMVSEELLLGSEDGNDSEISYEDLKDKTKNSIERKSTFDGRKSNRNSKSRNKKKHPNNPFNEEFKKLNEALKKELKIKRHDKKTQKMILINKLKNIEKMTNAALEEENKKEENTFRCCGLIFPLQHNKEMPRSLEGNYTPSEIGFREASKQSKITISGQ